MPGSINKKVLPKNPSLQYRTTGEPRVVRKPYKVYFFFDPLSPPLPLAGGESGLAPVALVWNGLSQSIVMKWTVGTNGRGRSGTL